MRARVRNFSDVSRVAPTRLLWCSRANRISTCVSTAEETREGRGKKKKKKGEGKRACVSFSPRQAVAPKSDNPLNVAEAVSYDVTWMEGRVENTAAPPTLFLSEIG